MHGNVAFVHHGAPTIAPARARGANPSGRPFPPGIPPPAKHTPDADYRTRTRAPPDENLRGATLTAAVGRGQGEPVLPPLPRPLHESALRLPLATECDSVRALFLIGSSCPLGLGPKEAGRGTLSLGPSVPAEQLGDRFSFRGRFTGRTRAFQTPRLGYGLGETERSSSAPFLRWRVGATCDSTVSACLWRSSQLRPLPVPPFTSSGVPINIATDPDAPPIDRAAQPCVSPRVPRPDRPAIRAILPPSICASCRAG